MRAIYVHDMKKLVPQPSMIVGENNDVTVIKPGSPNLIVNYNLKI